MYKYFLSFKYGPYGGDLFGNYIYQSEELFNFHTAESWVNTATSHINKRGYQNITILNIQKLD